MSEIKAMVLADKPAESYVEEMTMAGALIQAAKEDRIAIIVGTHHETGEEGVIMCGINPVENTNNAQYIPLAMLFTSKNQVWADYNPPEVAAPSEPEPDPMDVFNEEEDDSEDGS